MSTLVSQIFSSPTGFLEVLILVLLAILFFKEEIMRWFNKNVIGRQEPITRLANYYNHDLTEKLTSIDTSLKAILDAERDEHLSNDGMRELMKDTNSLLRELKEYGVKCRP